MVQELIHATGIDIDDVAHLLVDMIPDGWRIAAISHTVHDDRATAMAVLEPDSGA